MISRSEWSSVKKWAWDFVLQAGIPLHAKEFEYIEIAELGLGELAYTGVQILTIASTEWLGVKILILKPNQFFPQHRHPPSKSENYPGKIEVLRGQYGKAWLYVPGEKTPNPKVTPPPQRFPYCTVWREVPLGPGDQFICLPNTWHWFQAGPKGAVIWSISSKVTDEADQFFDPQVVRQTQIQEDYH